MAKQNKNHLKKTALAALREADTNRLRQKFALLNDRELEFLAAINAKLEAGNSEINTLPPCPICNPG